MNPTLLRQGLTRQGLARYGLMLGNFATGLSVLAPAGMLSPLADGLSVSIQQAGLLVTFGAIIVCIGSPVGAWLTASVNRRTLMVTILAVMTVGQAAMALAPNYTVILILRLFMLAVAAVFTPQAASTISLLVPERARSGAISFVFLGWALAVAAGLPLITLISGYAGWRVAFAFSAFASFVPCMMLLFGLPKQLRGPPLSLGSFAELFRNPKILLLLGITVCFIGSQFALFVYLGPLFTTLAGASHETVGLVFLLYGVLGFSGNMVASRIVGRIGGWKTSAIFLTSVFIGMVIWTAGLGNLALMMTAVAFLGMGFASSNSIQQARLVQVAPALAGASVALNTTAVYIGQAVGSGAGGYLYGAGTPHLIGIAGVVFVSLALLLWTQTRDTAKPVP